MKKIKLFGSALVLMAVVGAAAPASAAVKGQDSADTTITIKNIEDEDHEDFNKLQLKAVPTKFNYGTHEVSAGTITATATSTPTNPEDENVIEGDVRVMDTRYAVGDAGTAPGTVTPIDARNWKLSASYTQTSLKAANNLVSLKLTMGAANNGGATGSVATLTDITDDAAAPVVTVSGGSVGTYVFDKLTSTMEIADTNAGTYTGTINFTLDDTL